MSLLQTERTLLRELTLDDAEFVLRLLNEPSFLQFIGDRGVRDLDDARAYLRDRFLSHYREHGFGLWAVIRRQGDVTMGICGLLRRPVLEHPDLGFAFLPEHWRRGYAFESAQAVLEHAREDLGLQRIVAVTQPGNRASIALLEKLGFQFERMVRLSEDEDEVRLYGLHGPPGA